MAREMDATEATLREILGIAEETSPSGTTMERIAAAVEKIEQYLNYDIDAEAYAAGTRGGVPVEEGDPAYHNNAAYYAGQMSGVVDDVNDLKSDIGIIENDLNIPLDLGLEVGAFNTTTDISIDSTNSKRARTSVFKIIKSATIHPLQNFEGKEYHVFKQVGDVVTQLSTGYQSGDFAVDDTNAIYRLFVRNEDSSTMTVNSDPYFTVVYADYYKDEIRSNRKEINDVKYGTDVDTFISTVKSEIAPTDYVFVLSADNHYDEMQEAGAYQLRYAETIANVAKEIGASAIVNLGDMSNSDIDDGANNSNYNPWVNRSRAQKIVNAFIQPRVPFLYAIGHHELFPRLDIVDGEQLYGVPKSTICLIAHRPLSYNAVYQDGDLSKPNFYVDDAAHSLRLIFLDGVSITNTGFSYSTIEFLSSSLSSLPSGYKVICFSHTPTRASANANGTEVPGGNIQLEEAQLPTGISEYTNTIESIINDFVSGGGVFLGFFHGHVHIDNLVQESGMQFKLIAENCQKIGAPSTSQFNAITGGGNNKKRWTGRTNANDSAYSFDVVVIRDTTIYMFRYGAGENRIITHT